MRMGVIDVGSNTVHLLVVDAFWGAHPIPASKHKVDLRLFDHMDADGIISDEGAERLLGFVRECLEVADDYGVESLMGFATSAIRESPNGDAILERVRVETGVELKVLSGADESRLTFLAARRWHGWSAGRILLVDIGGGSLELASGIDEDPDVALSLPLGAGRITRDHLPGDPPKPAQIKKVRKMVRTEIARVVRDLNKVGEPDLYVGTSKTIRSLARLTGAAPSTEGIYTRRVLRRDALKEMLPQLAAMPQGKRAELPGVSVTRSRQVLGGAMVIEAAMDLLGIEELVVCPWALREGVILQELDLIPAP
ncbi:Ppx/GppA phosphatase family protein [Mobilicoccus pelagius]|uniref:Putative phosphatase n=1 Tax=Mobilicoccus pelagius NBRC 104925 TaxID=1089455 RepID=H5US46_9MICO|nr:Ppx/GppA phosphatase family protein [Mobilicoccus pelagius]GAB48554.1 putative phosphatase [Mobilicoccus pelagius NBRC 104925]